MELRPSTAVLGEPVSYYALAIGPDNLSKPEAGRFNLGDKLHDIPKKLYCNIEILALQFCYMNRLAQEKRVQVISALVEGTSINATCRITGVAKHTVLNLLRDLGCAAASYHDKHVRNLRVRNLQCDEIWQFVYAKQKNVSAEQMAQGAGDVWTWIAIDADTKLVINYCRIHKTLRVTPAMEAGLTDHVWTIEELIGLTSQIQNGGEMH
jgi:hypothetical protein